MVAEDLVLPDNIECYLGAIASVIRSARTLIEEVPRSVHCVLLRARRYPVTAAVDAVRIRAEVRELQKTSAVLACIQCAAEYGNERDVAGLVLSAESMPHPGQDGFAGEKVAKLSAARRWCERSA